MRRGNEPELVYGESGEIVGVNLSADFTAEHEWGIDGLRRAFGVKNDISIYGAARRQITNVPDVPKPKEYQSGLYWFKQLDRGEGAGFAYCRDVVAFKYELQRRGDNLVSAAWDGDTFAVVGWTEKAVADLEVIYEAVQRKDACILRGGAQFIENPGLVIGILSRLPKSVTDAWTTADREHHEVCLAVAKLGIEEKLKKAGRDYFALSPKRKPDGSLHFWLNPREQDKNNFGWYTVADLEQWIEGRGPIPKKKRAS